MRNINLTDTIAAIATPIGESGIGIVRLSGKDALKIADKIFVPKDVKKPADFKTYTVHYGWIVDRKQKIEDRKQKAENNKNLSSVFCPLPSDSVVIDEVILTVMRAPKSYTKEDIVELNCHGGIVALRRVLELVLENGCRLAEPGEFTRRAFLNGRIDLTQAEAVLDIIKAKTDTALRVGIKQLKGGLSKEIQAVRETLLGILSSVEVNIDFPEEEVGSVNVIEISRQLKTVHDDLSRILDTSQAGRIFREGIHVVICGKPNVGKSSLLNALLKQERSIVTPIAGTTRDTIEEIIDIRGIPVRIVDTAGIIEPRDLVEKKAITRSKKCIDDADLALVLFDSSKRIDRFDENLMKRLGKNPAIAVINKIDLKPHIEKDKITKRFNLVVDISAKKMERINVLEDAIADLVYRGEIKNSDSIMVSNIRHIASIKKIKKLIAEAINALDNTVSLEFVSQGIRDALEYLDEILGKKFSEELLDKIFSEFCIGK